MFLSSGGQSTPSTPGLFEERHRMLALKLVSQHCAGQTSADDCDIHEASPTLK
jgi:hypothetical protein